MPYIEGVHVANPAAVWHEIKNAKMVMDGRRTRRGGDGPGDDDGGKGVRWNNETWFTSFSASGFTMCLSNALKFTFYGKSSRPGGMENRDITQAEEVVMAVIANTHGRHVSIPSFNDTEGRTWEQIEQVLDKAADIVKPFAFEHTVTYAAELLTPQERKEQDALVWEAERELWQQAYPNAYRDSKGFWRQGGKFVPKPKHGSWLRGKLEDAAEKNPVMAQFVDWLEDHEARGWDTFWDELAACGDDEECRDKVSLRA